MYNSVSYTEYPSGGGGYYTPAFFGGDGESDENTHKVTRYTGKQECRQFSCPDLTSLGAALFELGGVVG